MTMGTFREFVSARNTPLARLVSDYLTQFDALSDEERERIRETRSAVPRYSLTDTYRDTCGITGDMQMQTLAAFSQFNLTHSQRNAMNAVAAWLSRFKRGKLEPPRGLLLVGDCGVGKDHLIRGVVLRIVSRPKPARAVYIYAPDIDRQAKLEWQTHSDPETRVEEQLRTASVVAIGDIHKPFELRQIAARDILIRLIDQADRTGRPILLASSNWDMTTWDNEWRDLADRLCGLCHIIEVTGSSGRRRGISGS